MQDVDVTKLNRDELVKLAGISIPTDPHYEGLRKELRSLGISEASAFGAALTEPAQVPLNVIVTDIRIPFETVMGLTVKATVASLIVAFVLFVIYLGFRSVVGS